MSDLVWSTEKPKQPGQYRWREEGDVGDGRAYAICTGWMGMLLWFRDEADGWVPVASNGEWAGPIPRPKEPQP